METIIGTDIREAASLLNRDEIVAIPTETVYGLAGNGLSEIAVSKIYIAKNRPSFNPLIIHVAAVTEIDKYAIMDHASRLIANKLMPGPITLLLPKKKSVPDITTAGSNKVAIRVPNHSMSLALLTIIPFPLAAPSANPSGYISPTNAEHVFDGLQGKIPYILNGGNTTIGVESTICEVINNTILLHRAGGISAAELSQLTGLEVKHSISHEPVASPGQLKSHYAPYTPLIRGDIHLLLKKYDGKRIAIISFQNNYTAPNTHCYRLSAKGDLAEAANQLFATIRKIDQLSYDVILAEIFPQTGIGAAINDRIGRAQFLHKSSSGS